MHGFNGSIFEANKPKVKENFRVAIVLINVMYILSNSYPNQRYAALSSRAVKAVINGRSPAAIVGLNATGPLNGNIG
jgi:hypothetical protein